MNRINLLKDLRKNATHSIKLNTQSDINGWLNTSEDTKESFKTIIIKLFDLDNIHLGFKKFPFKLVGTFQNIIKIKIKLPEKCNQETIRIILYSGKQIKKIIFEFVKFHNKFLNFVRFEEINPKVHLTVEEDKFFSYSTSTKRLLIDFARINPDLLNRVNCVKIKNNLNFSDEFQKLSLKRILAKLEKNGFLNSFFISKTVLKNKEAHLAVKFLEDSSRGKGMSLISEIKRLMEQRRDGMDIDSE